MADRSDGGNAPQLLKRSFAFTTSAAHKSAAGNPMALKALSGIERRAAAVRQRALDLHQKFEDRWTAKEAIRLWERHLARSAQHPGLSKMKQAVPADEILKIAARNVRARTNRRLSKIMDIKTRMANATVRNLGSPSLTASFGEAAVVRLKADEVMKPKQRRKP